MTNCGIYLIYNIIDNRVYIGSSNNIKRRINRHFRELKNNTHGNRYLQRFINKYGVENLKWKILLNCNKDDLVRLETDKILEYKSLNYKNGFNLILPDNTCKSYRTRKAMSNSKINSKFNKIINVIKDNKVIFSGNIDKIKSKFEVDPSSVYKILSGIRKIHKGLSFIEKE